MTTATTPAAEQDLRAADAPWEDDPGYPLDPIDRVTEVSTMMSVYAAERFERVDALRRDALAETEVFRGAVPEIIERSLRLELATALQITEYAADRMLRTAEALVDRYRPVLDALFGARITERHAEIFVELVDAVEPSLRERVVAAGVELAETQPAGAFRRRLRALVESVRADTLAERHRHAVADRRVAVEHVADGMAWLMVHLPAVEAHAIFQRITALAGAAAEERDPRTLDQRRADVVADLLVEGDVARHPDRAHGIRATVAVTVPALSLLAGDDGAPEGPPPIVDGVGPIPLSRARELCGGADAWMRILTHPVTGVVLSIDRTRYRPPPDLVRLVSWRASRCMAPGCGVPASRCQIDHQVAWQHGGVTAAHNLAPLCQGHHTIKHHGGWLVRQTDGGAVEWTSPLGRRYVVQPERRIPAFHDA